MRNFILAVTGLAFSVTACSSHGTSVVEVEKVPVASISLQLPAPTLIRGQTARALATPRDATGAPLPDRPITWQSSSTAIASISATGDISAVAPGTAIISASSEGVSAQASMSVMDPAPAPVANVSVALAASSLAPSQTTQATATTRDASNNVLTGRAIAWSSSNTGVATVSSSGLVTAVATGSAQIIATSEGQSGNSVLTVTATPPAPVASVTVSLASGSLNSGQTTQATATTRDANNNVLTGRSIAWSTSNGSVATVSSSGLVTAVSAGTAQITATSEGQSGSATLTVTTPPPAPVASVTVSLAASTRNIGQTTQATATTRDANNNVLTGRVIAWSSSNTGVATVSSSGLVTAIAAGSAQIIATSEGQSGNAVLTVNAPAPVASVTVALTASSLNPGETTQATATTRDANNNVLTGRAIAWSSDNTAAATVSGSGLVTAVAVGTAHIIATSEGQSGNATLTVVAAPPPPPPGSSNEPSGMTLITERAFNALNEPGWNDASGAGSSPPGSITIFQDATAPKSPSNVLRATYPTGFTSGGDGPGSSDFFLNRPRTLYVSYWARLSSNWYGHDSGVNKQFYAYANGVPVMYMDASCVYNGAITPRIALQDTKSNGTSDLLPNLVPSARIIRGQWYHIEVVLVGNTAGVKDGSVDWYLDGVHIGSYSVQWQTGAATWNLFHYTTIWGGVGGPTVPATQYMDWDHVYLSGKN